MSVIFSKRLPKVQFTFIAMYMDELQPSPSKAQVKEGHYLQNEDLFLNWITKTMALT